MAGPSRTSLLDAVLPADARRLQALAKKLAHFQQAGKPHDRIAQQLADLHAEAQARHATRLAALPNPAFPEDLPIAQARERIASAISAHPVVVVCGETGSGKTTQLPKICLALKRGLGGLVGCTQPRRIAARSLAARLARELHPAPQTTVGYKVRFTDHTHPDGFVKVMTDGILLAETHGDPDLLAYDTLIIDEAHERSLNIDFLLGYLKRLIARRADLKLIITSATIDPERFAKHFASVAGPAPVIEVSGRTYPVEVRHHPEYMEDAEGDALDLAGGVARAVDELAHLPGGDLLVFLPGEREIRECAEALRKHHPKHLEILPLFGRLSNAEQDRIFEPAKARRVVLATNVAETSLTVPGIQYVIDSGLARVNRYSARSKLNLLQIEKISRASARQRAGRCGRVAAGVAVRLYSAADFDERPEFTTPEILRTSLASVILRMLALDLGAPADFPFLEPPGPRMIEDGYRQLFELGAVDAANQLTPLGRDLARLPIDPRVGRMLLAARATGCVEPMLVICAALSVQDPRERPLEARDEAARQHEAFADPQSDFAAYLNLWEWFARQQEGDLSHRKLNALLREKFLSPVRMREWREVHAQLRELLDDRPSPTKSPLQPTPNAKRQTPNPIHYDALHRALLTGLLGNVGMKAPEGDHYLGVRGIQFRLPFSKPEANPTGARAGSSQRPAARRSRWVMAAELAETNRVYARTTARIEPEWIEELGAHLLTREHFGAHWDRQSAQVIAYEKVSLHGLVVNPRKRVHFGAIDPGAAREIFIREGLVAGEYDTPGNFLAHNLALMREVEELEHMARRQDVLIDPEAMADLYAALIPEDVVNGAGFERWRKHAEQSQPRVLYLTREALMRRGAAEITQELFPKVLVARTQSGTATLPLTYRFEPGHVLDGVTLTLPVAALNQIDPVRFDWLVPGMLRDKVAALIKTLPQRSRSQYVPLPDTVGAFIEVVWADPALRDLSGAATPLTEALAGFLASLGKGVVKADDFDATRVPMHLNMNLRVIDADGAELAMSRDPAALIATYGEASRTVFSTLHRNQLEQEGLTQWSFGDLPASINFERDGLRYDGFPALVDRGESVAIKIFDTEPEALREHRAGLTRLMLLGMADSARQLARGLKLSPVAAFQYAAIAQRKDQLEAFAHEVLFAACSKAFFEADLPRSQRAFVALREARRVAFPVAVQQLATTLNQAFELLAQAKAKLDDKFIKTWEHVEPDIRTQLALLFAPGFIIRAPFAQLAHYPRYLKAIAARLDKLKAGGMERDLERARKLRPLWQQYTALKSREGEALDDYRWMLEELRVSLFAQELKTPYPVSFKRVAKVWEALPAGVRAGHSTKLDRR